MATETKEQSSTAKRTGPDWPRLVGDSLRQYGPWHTWNKLQEAFEKYPDDAALRGYLEIVRNVVVRDLLDNPAGLKARPKITQEFMTDFERFNLNAQEGYLASLLDGRLSIEKLLKVTPFDSFTTLFTVARLLHLKVVSLPAHD